MCVGGRLPDKYTDGGATKTASRIPKPAVRALVLLVDVALSGCSASEIVQNWAVDPPPDLSQPNYRRIVADNISTIFPEQTTLGDMEISSARPVDHLKGSAWLTCLKLDAHGNPQNYAVFIQGDKVIDFREGIMLDQCHKETYSPLEVTKAAKRP
jgi:hypothetical protein